MRYLFFSSIILFAGFYCYAADSMGRNYVTVNCNPEYLDQLNVYGAVWKWKMVYQDPDSLIWYSSGEDDRSVVNYYKQAANMLSRKINFSVALFKDGQQVSGTQKDGFTPAGDAYLTMGTLVVPVTFVSQPNSRTNAIGSSASFSVSAYGGTPLSYQWRKNNVNISGANSSSYNILSVSASDAGTYTCLVTNPAGFRLTAAANLTVNFSLIKNVDPAKGSISLSPDQTNYSSGQSVLISATPNPGYIFKDWSGFISSTSNPVTVIMDDNKTVTANFENDSNDSDGDGLSNYDEVHVYSSNPNLQDSSNDGINDGVSVGLGYSPLINFTSLKSYYLTNPPAGLYTTNQIMDMNIGKLLLTKSTNSQFVLNYDIQHSTNLSSWSIYSSQSVVLSNLPADKSFIRIRTKE